VCNPGIDKRTLKTFSGAGNAGADAVWKMSPLRISVCFWQTTKEDIDDCAEVLVLCREQAPQVLTPSTEKGSVYAPGL
jgi:hypothetical protein